MPGGRGALERQLISRGGGRERHVLDFIGPAPAAADPTRATEDELAGGPKACATPGNLGGWQVARWRLRPISCPRWAYLRRITRRRR